MPNIQNTSETIPENITSVQQFELELRQRFKSMLKAYKELPPLPEGYLEKELNIAKCPEPFFTQDDL